MVRFDPKRRMEEIHGIHDTLCKIRSGKLLSSELGQEFINNN
jgi:hypothetical protein